MTGTGREPYFPGYICSFKYAHRCVVWRTWVEWDSEVPQRICDCMISGKHIYRSRLGRYVHKFLQMFRRPLIIRVDPSHPLSADLVQQSLANDADTLSSRVIENEDTVRLQRLAGHGLEGT